MAGYARAEHAKIADKLTKRLVDQAASDRVRSAVDLAVQELLRPVP